MKYKNFIIKTSLFLFIVCCTITSCRSDDDLNSKDLKVYISTGFPENELSNNFKITPVGIKGDKVTQIKVGSTRELITQAEVSFEIDAALVDTYNASHKTEYTLLPTAAYTVDDVVVIEQGKQLAQTPLKIEITKSDILSPGTTYILPVRMKNLVSNDKGVAISSNFNTAYVIYNIEYSNVDIEALTLDGKEVAQTTMEIKSGEIDITEDLTDNDYNTFWYSESSPVVLTIDMKGSLQISGFKSTPMYIGDFYYGDVSKISNVETSIDGQTWQSQGSAILPNVGGSATNPKFQFVKFYLPVTCRYLRLTIDSSNSYLIGLSEFYLIN